MKLLFLFLALCAAALAQDVERVFQLKYAEPNEVKALLNGFPGTFNPVNPLHVISVRGSKDMVEAVAEMIKKIDVPPPVRRNIEFTGYLINASSKAGESVEPPEIAPVIKQLRSLFPYKTYRVVETFFLRCRDGQQGATSGYIFVDELSRKPYNISFSSASLTEDKLVRLNNLNLTVNPDTRGFRTDVDIHEGQKVVVGKSNMTGGDDAIILVLGAKVVE